MYRRQRAPGYNETAVRGTSERRDAALDFGHITNPDGSDRHSERGRRSLNSGELADPRGACIPDDRCAHHSWRDLFEQFEPFRTHAEFVSSKTGGIAAWPCKTLDDTGTDWIRKEHENRRHRPSCLLGGRRGRGANRQDHVRYERDQFFGISASSVGVAQREAIINSRIAPDSPTQLLQTLQESGIAGL